MSTHRTNFDAWYKRVLDLLYPHRDAGFAILMIAFPLLERYLRQKTGLTSAQNLSDAFFDELTILFPALGTNATSKNFWQIYRNGLLHEITLSRQSRSGTAMPTGWVSHDKPLITFESDGSIWINPVEFAQRVIATIESDFTTFEAASPASTRLPTVKPQPTATSTGVTPGQRIILGTNTDP
jgi:hypothetical protein